MPATKRTQLASQTLTDSTSPRARTSRTLVVKHPADVNISMTPRLWWEVAAWFIPGRARSAASPAYCYADHRIPVVHRCEQFGRDVRGWLKPRLVMVAPQQHNLVGAKIAEISTGEDIASPMGVLDHARDSDQRGYSIR